MHNGEVREGESAGEGAGGYQPGEKTPAGALPVRHRRCKRPEIERTYLSSWHLSYERQLGRRRSHLDFGLEWLSESNFESWNRAFNTSTYGSMALAIRLGNWVAVSPRIWRVFYDQDKNIMEVLHDEKGLIRYEYDSTRNFRNPHFDAEGVPSGVPATAEEMSEESVRLMCQSNALFTPEEVERRPFRELLNSWGGEWMWEDLRMTESPEGVAECLRNKTLICVTDGSYAKKKASDVCSAGWIMACR